MPAINKVLSKCCKINDTVFRLPHGSRYLGVWKVLSSTSVGDSNFLA